ncbi:MAG: hypothetical protein IJF84_13290 [Thermoguttaceae bacterium]|nr:hypothetical protein [Thermoguttaceae bacterium]
MRYTLNMKTKQKEAVRLVEVEGRTVFNPSDELLDKLGIGCPYEESSPPALEDENKTYSHSYTIENGVIKDVWEVQNIPPRMIIAKCKQEIARLNADSDNYKNNGSVQYDGKGYIPRWVFEFYNAMINLNQMTEMFPCDIASDDGTSRSFTYEEFLQLYATISMTFAEYTRQVNSRIAELNAQIKLLEDA